MDIIIWAIILGAIFYINKKSKNTGSKNTQPNNISAETTATDAAESTAGSETTDAAESTATAEQSGYSAEGREK